MKTSKEAAQKILTKIQQATDAHIRSMMGEYLLYANGVLVGQINHEQVFIKSTLFGERFAPELIKESPYDGAKPALVIPDEKINDSSWLKDFLTGTVQELSAV